MHETLKGPQLQSRLHSMKRVDLALEAVEAYEVTFRLPHRARVLEEAHPGFRAPGREDLQMNSATKSPPSHGTTEGLRQKLLTERLGVSPARRSKASNLKWSTWKWRLRMRGPA